MKLILYIILTFVIYQTSNAQKSDTIRGKILSSINQKVPKSNIYVRESNSKKYITIDSSGVFEIVPEKMKKVYMLEIYGGNYPNLIYEFKSKWTKRKEPKLIALKSECIEYNFNIDWNGEKSKLYYWNKTQSKTNKRKNQRFEEKHNISYAQFNSDNHIYECVEEYNRQIMLRLDLLYGNEWRKTVRNDIICMKN